MQTKPLILALLAGLSFSGAAQAVLMDRGGGLIYDTVLNITWLQDANYAKTSGYDTDGFMPWASAVAWAANLSYYDSVRGVTYDDWRLPTVSPINGSTFNYNDSNMGTTDRGYNVSAPGSAYAGATGSELAYMYYNNLGLKGYYSLTGAYQPDFGIFGNGITDGQKDVGLINNLQSGGYWSGTDYAPLFNVAWYFGTAVGDQAAQYKNFPNRRYAWAVRPGDVAAPIPEPETYALLLAGLGLVGWAARRRRGKFGASGASALSGVQGAVAPCGLSKFFAPDFPPWRATNICPSTRPRWTRRCISSWWWRDSPVITNIRWARNYARPAENCFLDGRYSPDSGSKPRVLSVTATGRGLPLGIGTRKQPLGHPAN